MSVDRQSQKTAGKGPKEVSMNGERLTALKAGTTGTVVAIEGGAMLSKRLDALGIRPGVNITKRSSQLLRGPVTIVVGNAQVAIGHGMAKRILMNVKRQ
jgi:ferrous iron transport protein A